MRIDPDYMAMMRRGKWLDKQTYRKEQESGIIVGMALIGCLVIIVLAVIF